MLAAEDYLRAGFGAGRACARRSGTAPCLLLPHGLAARAGPKGQHGLGALAPTWPHEQAVGRKLGRALEAATASGHFSAPGALGQGLLWREAGDGQTSEIEVDRVGKGAGW